MTKSRIALIALAIGCIAMLGAGTAAYFTVQDTAYNVITTGILDMTLVEKTTDGAQPGTELEDLPEFPVYEDGTPGVVNVMPGETVSKIPYVENSGTADFYTRVKVTLAIKAEDGSTLETDEVLALEGIKPDVWVLKDGWYYYTEAVAPGSRTEPLFTGVTFDAEDMGNEYQNAEVRIDVYAQAVQSKNNGDTWQDVNDASWPIAE